MNSKTIVPQDHEELHRELRLESQIENFCAGCDYLEEFKDYEDWGSETVYRCSDYTCKADLCPDSPNCPRYDEYIELQAKLEEIEGDDDGETI